MSIQRSPSVALFLSAESLTVTANQPQYLNKRLLSKPAPPPSAHTENRDAFLRSRIQKLREKSFAAAQKLHRHRQKSYNELYETRKHLAETLHDAEIKRDKIIHEQQRTNAMHVVKAKEISRKQNLMKAEKLDKYRRELEHKLKSSQIRRKVLITKSKSQILLPLTNVVPEISMEEAALRIQRWWTQKQLKPLIRRYRKVAVSMEDLADMSLPELMRKVQEPELLSATTELLAFVRKRANKEVKKLHTPAKIFLASYMIIPHPEEIFAEVGEEENDLRDAASTMLTDMHAWLSSYKSSIVHGLMSNFISSWLTFHHLFSLWKDKDTSTIIDAIIVHWIELERIWLSTRDNVDAPTEWIPNLRKQQKLLHSQLVKVAGKEMLPEFERKCRAAAMLEFGEVPSDSMGTATSITQDSVLPQSSSTADLAKVPAEEVMENFGDVLSNEMMAHELMMDPDYKMKRPQLSALEASVTEMAEKAFFDRCKEDAEKGDLKWMADLLDRVHKKLIDIMPEGAVLAREVNEVFEPELLNQQLEQKSLDVPKMLRYILHIMKQLAAPIRDAALLATEQLLETDQILCFRSILTVLDDMALDSANHSLQTIKPHLKQIASEYESTKFAAALKENRTTLDLTTQWLHGVIDNLMSVAAQRNPENIMVEGGGVPKYDKIFADGLVALLSKQITANKDNTPETFSLDINRLGTMQNEVQGLSIVAAIIMLMRNVVPSLRKDEGAVRQLKDLLFIVLESENASIDNLTNGVIKQLNETLAKESKPLLNDDQCTLVQSLIDKTLNVKDSIFLLIQRRVLGSIRDVIIKGELNKPALAKQGLDCIEIELDALCRRSYALAKFNREVYAPWYDEIIRNHLADIKAKDEQSI